MLFTNVHSRRGANQLPRPATPNGGERFFHLIDPDGHELSFARPLLSSVSFPRDQNYSLTKKVKQFSARRVSQRLKNLVSVHWSHQRQHKRKSCR